MTVIKEVSLTSADKPYTEELVRYWVKRFEKLKIVKSVGTTLKDNGRVLILLLFFKEGVADVSMMKLFKLLQEENSGKSK